MNKNFFEVNMSKEKEIKYDRPIKFFGLMLPRLPGLIFRLGGTFIWFKGQANKAGKIFRKELINQGFDKKTATDLTNIYLEGSNLIRYMQNFS